MPKRWAQTERSAASKGGAGSGLLSRGFEQSCGLARLRRLSARRGGCASRGCNVANHSVRWRDDGGRTRGARFSNARRVQGREAACPGGAWSEQQLAQAASRQGAGSEGAAGDEMVVRDAGQGLARQGVAGGGEHGREA
eukprot:1191798-Prorocentrum_minimum.AAC.2